MLMVKRLAVIVIQFLMVLLLIELEQVHLVQFSMKMFHIPVK
nr:MAG TPA: hypothetical protein [Bacteriophage sp.]